MPIRPALLALSLLASAGDPRLERAFAGTIVSTYPDGRTALLWLDRGGGYRGLGRRRTSSSGTWVLKGERICMKQHRPFFIPFSYCTDLPSAETWRTKAATGETVSVALQPGRDGALGGPAP